MTWKKILTFAFNTHENNQDNLSPGRDSQPEIPECDAGVPNSRDVLSTASGVSEQVR
jgi:hypothetical protein